MTRPPLVRGIFSLGLSVAVLKGVEKTVRKHLERQGWIEPQKVDYELIFTIDRLKNLVDNKREALTAEQPDAGELSWRKVFNFISRQSSELDTRIYVLILLLSFLLPIAWTVLDGDRETTLEDKDNDFNVDLIENERRLKHYNDGERAVLQFGKNRSEPIILSYKDMNVLEGEHEFTSKEEHSNSHLTSKSENALNQVGSEDLLGCHLEKQLEEDKMNRMEKQTVRMIITRKRIAAPVQKLSRRVNAERKVLQSLTLSHGIPEQPLPLNQVHHSPYHSRAR
ncbi:ANL_collapsed_G0025180.mRNA.1.CDS.1 [Saccharomyces cerevisiae]|nr:ANL_collapsed_G0025180.mRNA.1.CDS.1 [Saccharomyces cerevisiae]